MAELCFSIDDIYFVCFKCILFVFSNTAADTASEYDSSGLVPLPLLPAPRQAGRACSALLSIVLALVAVRFGLCTMMAELCFSVDDCILFVFSNTAADTAR